MALRTRNAVLLAKIEPTEGQDAAPSASTDAVLVENPQINFNPNLIETDEVTGSLDGAGPIVGGMTAEVTFDVLTSDSSKSASSWSRARRNQRNDAGEYASGMGWEKLILALVLIFCRRRCK